MLRSTGTTRESVVGPMLLTGLACLGAALGLALVVSSTTREESLPVRRLAVITMAFAEGIAVFGVMVGLLAVFGYPVATASDGFVAGVPAIGGAVVGLAMVLRNRDHTNPAITTIGSGFILGLGTLGAVVWVMAIITADVRPKPVDDGPFVILGAIAGLAALTVGIIGSRGVPRLYGVSDEAATAIASAHITRLLPIDLLGIGASAIAILLLVSA